MQLSAQAEEKEKPPPPSLSSDHTDRIVQDLTNEHVVRERCQSEKGGGVDSSAPHPSMSLKVPHCCVRLSEHFLCLT